MDWGNRNYSLYCISFYEGCNINTLINKNESKGGGEFNIIINADGGGTGGLRVYNWANTAGVGTTASGTTGEIRATNNITAYYRVSKSIYK
jgi:hypothetical protein